jgi:2-deoxy-D-gluconate 3-dehydrogenase
MLEEFFSLDGQTALVTGGNGGIGRAIALGFRTAGAYVAVSGRNPEKNAAMAAALGEGGAVFEADLCDEAAVERLVAETVDRFGGLDILVNNAGTIRVSSILETPLEEWEEVVRVNLTAPFLCAKHAARRMVAQGQGGKIINVGSVVAYFGPPDFASYAATKSGLLGLTRALAVELAKHEIQVNAILPGYIETEMSAGVPGWLRDLMIQKTPAARWGIPRELVGMAIFLASPASSYVTGAEFVVDGGYTIADRLRYDDGPLRLVPGEG